MKTQDEDMQLQRVLDAGIILTDKQQKAYLQSPDVLVLKPGDSIPAGYKRCGGCKEFKKLYLFNQNKSAKDNCTGNCKECQKKASQKAYEKNKDAEKRREYYQQHREKKLEAGRKYYAENKEQVLKGQKKYHGTNKGKKAMTNSHTKRRSLLAANAGIPYNRDIIIDRDKQGGDRPECILCAKNIEFDRDIHMEHLIPVVLGGLNCFTNVACAHSLCNLQKSKDAREVTTEQVDKLIARSEMYMETHPEYFAEFFAKQAAMPKNEEKC